MTVRASLAMVTVLVGSLVGCIRLAEGPPTDAEIGEQAALYTRLVKINKAPYPTTRHADRPPVNVWANAVAATAYRELTLEKPRPAAFAEGSLLVKEMFLPDGSTVLAVRYKMPWGYDLKHGDWWYGMLRPTGVPMSPESVGTLAGCNGCHLEAATSDHTFGIPEAAR